ncbi:MAG: acyltransferase family protein [Candidatus Thorarchaeota archaeon]
MPELAADQTRVEWIDAAKGLGILSVILVHSIIPNVNIITTTLSSFTIPLFFIMAGLTYKSQRHRYDLRKFAISRGRQFLIPYFCLQIIMIILFYLLPDAVETYLTPNEVVFWFLYGSGPPMQSTHLWFLPVLYFGFLLFAVVDRLVGDRPRIIRFLLVPCFAVLAALINQAFYPMLVPWHIGAILVSCAYTLIGNELRKEGGISIWKTNSKVKDLLIILLAIASLFLLSELNGFTDIAVDNIGLCICIYLGTGTIGTIIVFIFASYIADSFETIRRGLVMLGNASQEIYEFHPLTFFLTAPIMFLFGWSIAEVGSSFDLLWPLRFALGVLVSTPVVLFVIRRNRILSFIFTGTVARRNRTRIEPEVFPQGS